jgi:hypothetical protein
MTRHTSHVTRHTSLRDAFCTQHTGHAAAEWIDLFLSSSSSSSSSSSNSSSSSSSSRNNDLITTASRISSAIEAATSALFFLLDFQSSTSNSRQIEPAHVITRITQLLQWLCAMAVGGGGSDVLMKMVVHAMVKDRSEGAGMVNADADSAAAAAAAAAAAERYSSSLAAESDDSCLCSLLSELRQVTCDV